MKNIPSLFVALICIAVVFSHGLYVKNTFQFPKWDEYIFMDEAIKTYDLLKTPSEISFKKIIDIYVSRPPLYGMTISFFLLIFGTLHSYKIALFINSFFYLGTILGIYLLARQFISKISSSIASFLFACYGFPLFYLHFVYSETAVTMFIIFSLYFFKKSIFFTNRKYSLLFSFATLASLLTRWTAPIFILGAVLAEIILIIMKRDFKIFLSKKFTLNLIIVFVISILVPLLTYYLPNIDSFLKYLSTSKKLSPLWVSQLNYLSPELSNTFSTRSIMFYFNILSQQTIFLFLLFSAGFIVSILKIKKYIFLSLSFIFIYAFLTLVFVLKDDRYIVPIYPIMAILSAIIFEEIKNKFFKYILIFLTIIFGILSFLGSSWAIGPMGQQGLKDFVLPEFIHHPRRIYLSPMVWPPRKNETNSNAIIDSIIKDKNALKKNILNTYTVNPMELDVAIDSVSKFSRRNEFYFSNLRVINTNDYKELFTRIKNSNYIIISKDRINYDKFSNENTDKMIIIFNDIFIKNPALKELLILIDTVYYPLDNNYLEIFYLPEENKDQLINEIKSFIKN